MKKIIQRTALLIAMLCLATSAVATADAIKDPKFRRLPYGEITPAGWAKQLFVQDITTGYMSCFHNSWMMQGRTYVDRGQSASENMGYHLAWNAAADGYYSLAYIANALYSQDSNALARSKKWIDEIIAVQDPDGYIGIYTREKREAGEPTSVGGHKGFLLQSFLYYAQMQKDNKVLDSVMRASEQQMKSENKGGKNTNWTFGKLMSYPHYFYLLYQTTKDRRYLEYAQYIYDHFSNDKKMASCFSDGQLPLLLDENLRYFGHACNTTSTFALPYISYLSSGDEKYLKAGKNAIKKFDNQASASGTLIGDEDVNGRDPNPEIPFETCTASYLVENVLIAGEIMGDTDLFDRAEKAMYNALMGVRTADGRACAYLAMDNCLDLSYEDIFHRYLYSSAPEPFCCNLRLSSALPVFFSHAYKTDWDGKKLYNLLWIPSEVNTKVGDANVNVRLETRYPFWGTIDYTIKSSSDTPFTFYIRKPEWLKGQKIHASGLKIADENGYIAITGNFNTERKIKLILEMPVESKAQKGFGYYLQRGPLVFVAKVPYTKIQIDTFPTQTKNKVAKQKVKELGENAEFFMLKPDVKIKNRLSHKSTFNEKAGSNFGFTASAVKVENDENVWAKSPLILKGALLSMRNAVPIELVPYGTTNLRRTVFDKGFISIAEEKESGKESGKKGGKKSLKSTDMIDENTSL